MTMNRQTCTANQRLSVKHVSDILGVTVELTQYRFTQRYAAAPGYSAADSTG